MSEILDLAALAHYRRHRVLFDHPRIAARVTRLQMLAEREALRAGYRTARLDLAEAFDDPTVVERALALYVELGREWHERADRVAAVARALPEPDPTNASPPDLRDDYRGPMSETGIKFTDAELAAMRERAAEHGTSVHDYVMSTATAAEPGDFVDKALSRFDAWVQDPAFAEADRTVDAG
ncbi:hypothetical protein ACWGR4_35995 [Embleya sp. NPDC055664]